MLAGSPSKVATVNPAHSASAASSVKSLRPSRAARRWASRMTSKRNACGVCAIRSRARSGVASTLPVVADQLDGVGDGNRGDRRAGAAGGIDRARDQRRPRRRAARRRGSERCRASGRRALRVRHAPRPAASRRHWRAAAWRRPLTAVVEHRGVVGIEHRLHRKDLRMAAERLHGAEDHGLPADRAVLLRSAGAGAKPAPGCDKDGCGPL